MIRPRLLLLAAVCFCIVWVAAFMAHEISTPGLVDRHGEAIGRDFIAFYTGAAMINRGTGASLYDADAQQQVATAVLEPDSRPGLCYFINPPHVALAYAPLAWLPYRLAFYLHVLLMLGCFWLGARALRPQLQSLQRAGVWPAAVLLCLSWFPMAQTILGGQNAALTFALLSAAYAALARGKQAHAGLYLGLQLFKPQYALPLAGLVLFRRCWVTVGVSAAVGVGAYLAGALCCGFRWPQTMAHAMRAYYAGAERLANGPKHVSLVEVVDYSTVMPLQRRGLPSLAATLRAASYGAVVLIAGLLLWRWRTADRRQSDFGLYWALAVATTMIIALHANDYDVGILALSALLIIDHRMMRGRPAGSVQRTLLVLAYFALPLVKLMNLVPLLRFQPFSLVPAALGLWAAAEIARERLARSQDAARGRPGPGDGADA
jgi:hypothetical protein